MNIARLAALVRLVAVFSAAWTLLVAMLILYWQLRSWLVTGDWNPVTISSALALADLEHPAMDVTTASVRRHFAWFLDLPASGILFAAAAILVALAILATSIEKQFAEPEE